MTIDEAIRELETNPRAVRFSRLLNICVEFFGAYRTAGSPTSLRPSGRATPEPFSKRRFSGRFVVRVPEALHRELAIRASGEGVSLNQLVNSKLEK